MQLLVIIQWASLFNPSYPQSHGWEIQWGALQEHLFSNYGVLKAPFA